MEGWVIDETFSAVFSNLVKMYKHKSKFERTVKFYLILFILISSKDVFF